jgi:hypothetical protein
MMTKNVIMASTKNAIEKGNATKLTLQVRSESTNLIPVKVTQV